MANDPVLDGREIQGDALAGFRKDHVRFLFLEIPEDAVLAARDWIAGLVDKIAYLDAVHAFNTAFSRMRARLKADPAMSACWLSLGFTSEGLRRLAPEWDYSALDGSFDRGAAASAEYVGDPTDGSPGDPAAWEVGGTGQAVHAMLTLAADTADDVNATANRIAAHLEALGLRVVFDQPGNVRTGSPGHEHFGFKDGISQPGVRGRIGPLGPLITRRLLDPADPLAGSFAAPGAPLLWPGEFILGYPRKKTGSIKPDDTMIDAVPAWMKNGSYAVFRKIGQDVAGFAASVAAEAARVSAVPGFESYDEDKLGAALVGRWKSGAPLMRAPLADDACLARDAEASNSFFFSRDTPVAAYDPAVGHSPDPAVRALRDSEGKVCPLSSHIRKVNPRDDVTDQGSPVKTLEHRIIRRGVPFGPDYDPATPGSAGNPRGLLFVCYQRSIEVGFEFLQHNWANDPNAPQDSAGADLVIGATGSDPRYVQLRNEAGVCRVSIGNFVHTQGGVYLFTPGRAALEALGRGGSVS